MKSEAQRDVQQLSAAEFIMSGHSQMQEKQWETQDDIFNGKMNVDIGIAAVRPAEFIILKFSHKMQESYSVHNQ